MTTFTDARPYRRFVASEAGRLPVFAGRHHYRNHPAFRKTVETSIYVAPEAVDRGVGAALYRHFFEQISGEDLHCAVVGVALPNEAPVRLHRKMGFKGPDTLSDYAIKNGHYVSSVLSQRAL
jgi:phosphinothricin acetyltransferase